MPLLFTYLVILAIGVFTLIVLVEAAILRDFPKFTLQLLILALVALVLHFTTGFPKSTRLVMFGGTSPLVAILIMFVCTLLGMVAHYIFYLNNKSFSWLALVKPLVVSPIILLPLVGSMQAQAALEPIQLISIAILAFQNGFFWEAVFADVGKEK